MVDCPFLKPEMLGSNKDCSSIEWASCLSTKRSNTLESAGSIETGRWTAFCFGLLDRGDVCSFSDAWKLRVRDTNVDDMCKRTRKEIANLFYIFNGNLVNASITVRIK